MNVRNDTTFSVGTAFWEDRQGGPRLTVVVKATYAVEDHGRVVPADAQLPIFVADQVDAEDPGGPFRFESDLAPFKRRADVVVVGHAHAPHGREVQQLNVMFRVGSMSKTIRVIGDRR